jgi:hypothetical protein
MARRSSSFDSPVAFIHDVLEESRSPSGTWSLATHNRLASFLGESSPETIDSFVFEMTKQLTDPACPSVQRFKLAQLCTTVRRICPRMSTVFEAFKGELMEVAARTADPIDPATAKLVHSLFAPLAPARPARTQLSTPICRVIPGRRRSFAMTPEPC